MNKQIAELVVALLTQESESAHSEVVPQTESECVPRMAIVVLDRGNVLKGRLSRTSGGYILQEASVIRRWGTTKGLGELVTGPTNETKLDPCGTVRFDSFIMSIDIEW